MNSSNSFQNNDDKSFKKALENAANPQPHLSQRKKNTRRKHRNSHLGCGTCKKRRIKCDENLPSCLNCLKGKLHCAYLNLDPTARNALRMAQYNQNLRLDSLNEVTGSMAASNGSSHQSSPKDDLPHHPQQPPSAYQSVRYQQLPNQQISHVLVSPNQTTPQPAGLAGQTLNRSPPMGLDGAVSSSVNPQTGQPQPVSHGQVHQTQPPSSTPTTAQLIQSPYGPMVSIQPYAMGPMGNVVYSNVPAHMQGMPVQVQTMPQVVQVPLPFIQGNGMISAVGGHMPQSMQQGQISVQPGQIPPQIQGQMVPGMGQHLQGQNSTMTMQAPVGRAQPIKPESTSNNSPVMVSPSENDSGVKVSPNSFTTSQLDGSRPAVHLLKNVIIKSEPSVGADVKLPPLKTEDKIDKVPTISKLLS